MDSLIDIFHSLFSDGQIDGSQIDGSQIDVPSILDVLHQHGIDLSLYSPEQIHHALIHAFGSSVVDVNHGHHHSSGNSSVSFTGSYGYCTPSDCSGWARDGMYICP